MSSGRDALLVGAQALQNPEGWKLTVVPFNLASSETIATITGIVKIRNIIGRCTAAVGTSSSLQLLIGGTVTCASTDIGGHSTLMIFVRESATNAVLTEVTTPVSSLLADPTPLIAGATGATTTLVAKLNASGTGVINWNIEWTPLTNNASVVAGQTA